MFRVDPKTVTRWAKAGKLTSIRTLGGHRRYREAEVRALLAVSRSSAARPEQSHNRAIRQVPPTRQDARTTAPSDGAVPPTGLTPDPVTHATGVRSIALDSAGSSAIFLCPAQAPEGRWCGPCGGPVSGLVGKSRAGLSDLLWEPSESGAIAHIKLTSCRWGVSSALLSCGDTRHMHSLVACDASALKELGGCALPREVTHGEGVSSSAAVSSSSPRAEGSMASLRS